MKRDGSLHVCLAMLCSALVLAFAGCATDPVAPSGAMGSLSLDLTVEGDFEIDEVAWTISGGDMPDMSSTIDTSASGSTASVEVFGLPEGDFIITLEATATDGETTCEGWAPFSIDPPGLTETNVLLRCQLPPRLGGVRVNGEINICAELTKVVVSPLQTSVGRSINLQSAAVDDEGDTVAYLWTAESGQIDEPSAANTTYACTKAGEDRITIAVSDDGFDYCMSEWTVPVTCVGDDQGFDFALIDVPGGSQESAKGVNNLGQIVGDYRPDDTVELPDGTDRFDIWVRQPDGTIDTFTLPTGFTAQVSSINDFGQVAGLSVLDEFADEVVSFGWVYDINTGEYRQYDYAPPGNEDAPDAAVTEVTNDGQTLVGWYDTSVNEFQYLGFVDSIDRGDFMTIDGPAERFTFIWGTNDSGLLVGREGRSGFVSTDGIEFDLFQVDGNFTTAFDVNNAGTVVGSYFLPGFEAEFGFVLNQGELTSGISAAPNAVRTTIGGVSDNGLIVGEFTDTDGDRHAFYGVFPSCIEGAGSIVDSTSTSILPNNQARGIAVGADGNSYAVSHAWTDDSFSDYFNQLVARTETGEIVSTYGVNGVVALDGPAPAFWEFLHPLPFPDGRLAVVGSAFDIDLSTVAFVTADGAIDSSRGDSGYALFDAFRAFDGVIDADNRIVVVGDRFGGPSGFVARLTVDGDLDSTFGDGGLFEVNHPDGTVKFRSVSLGADGSIVAAGTLETEPPAREVVLVAVTPDGKNLSEDFGVGGVARPAPQIERGIGWRVAHDESGGLIVGGFQGMFGSRDGFALRASAIDGTLDTDFGERGVRVLEEGFVTSLVLTPDYIWVGGQAGDFGNEMGWSVWRLLWSGDLDECIDDGQVLLDGEYLGGTTAGMAELADGTILLHGIDSVGALRLVDLQP